jgi:hypothetical protein
MCPETIACWDMGNVRVIFAADALWGFENFWFHSNLLTSWQAFSTRCRHTSKSLIGAEYTKVFRCHHSQKSRGLSPGDRAGQLTDLPQPIHCSQKVWFRCCLTMRRKLGGAPSWMNHMCCRWWRGTCSKSTGKSFTKRLWYASPVRLLGETSGPKSWSPKMSTLVPIQIQNSPISQQALISRHTLTGTFLFI